MSCFRPIPAGRDRASGAMVLWRVGNGDVMELACGRCIGCKMDRRRSWAIRIMHEASLYDCNYFFTLTYDDGKLAAMNRFLDPSLEYRDFQLFMKRLRKKLKSRIRFFCAGEYGGQFKRPHFHAIMFNCELKDTQRYVNDTLRSSVVEAAWGVGDVVIGNVSAKSAAYVAGYTLKKVHGAAAADHYEDVVSVRTGELSARRPEFVAMSLKPGIGAEWYRKFAGDLFPADRAVAEGVCYKVPRYYWKKFKDSADPLVVEEIEYERYLKAAEHVDDRTIERLLVREEVALARSELFNERRL